MSGRRTALLRRVARLESVARARLVASRGRAAILLYHRIASPSVDEWDLSVSVEAFEAQMALVASEFQPVALAELLAGQVPERAVAVTFDDGYVDNLDSALPVLERHSVPATVYVASSYVGRDVPFWWDEIERLAPAGVGDLQVAMRSMDADGIERALDEQRAAKGGDSVDLQDAGRCVRPDELTRLAASPLIEIGAHTHRHPSLRALSAEGAREEIGRSRSALADLLGEPPAAFSYPFGDLRRSTRALVREAGFTSAVATDWGVPYTPAADPFRIPREMVVEEPIEAFEARLERLVG